MIKITNEIFVHLVEKIISFSPKLLISTIIFLAFYVVALIFKKIVVKLGHKADKDKDKIKIFQLIGSTLKVVIIIIGLITALGTLGVDVTAMVAGLGLTGFALGLALKDALSNFLSGILILFYHPFRYGDKIKVAGCEGIVTDINLRYTQLDGGDTKFLIPNSTCYTNWIALSKKDTKKLSSDKKPLSK
jgi:small-conductance mechanosensitive channel